MIKFMKHSRRLAAGLAAFALATSALAQPTVIVVRHSERADGGKDPALSEAGAARAERLAELLAGSGVKAIYTTQYQRTRLTAQPLGKKLGVTPTIVPAADEALLIRRVQAHADADAVLVVGHSNTVPAIIRALGVRDEVKMADDEYDSLFVVVPRGEKTTALRIKY